MPRRDFNKEFNRLVAVQAAARDRTLRYFYWDIIHGGSRPLLEAHGLVEDEVCHVYNLSANQYREARVQVLADILGINTGGEFKIE